MKVLIVNKFWYRRGGDCVYAITLEQLLRNNGIETAVFAMRHPENINTSYDEYFPSGITFEGPVSMLKTAARSLGLGEVKRKFNALLDDFKPDVIHLNNIHTQLSPILAELAHRRGIKVVWTLHDYKILCPRYDCRQNGKINCTQCLQGSKWPVLKHKCMKDSLPASILAYVEALCWNKRRLERCVDKFICPSEFMRQRMLQGGFKAEKLTHLCNFIDTSKCRLSIYDKKEDYCCYVGRLSKEKGIKTFATVANNLPDRNFIVVGDGPLFEELKNSSGSNVKFVGRKEWPEVKDILSKAKFMVTPSEWYENNPLSVIESLCLGTPVLGAEIGGIPELLDNSNGMSFESENVDDLAQRVTDMFTRDDFEYSSIAERASEHFNSRYYFESLMRIYG